MLLREERSIPREGGNPEYMSDKQRTINAKADDKNPLLILTLIL